MATSSTDNATLFQSKLGEISLEAISEEYLTDMDLSTNADDTTTSSGGGDSHIHDDHESHTKDPTDDDVSITFDSHSYNHAEAFDNPDYSHLH